MCIREINQESGNPEKESGSELDRKQKMQRNNMVRDLRENTNVGKTTLT